jgi:hypothetical protein
LRLLIQQYFDIVDYVVSLYGHTWSIIFASVDMTDHWNVSFTSCCLNSLTMRALCGLSDNDDYQNGIQLVCLSRCHGMQHHWCYIVPCKPLKV